MTTATVHIRSMRWWDISLIDVCERDLFPHDPWSTDQWWRELAQRHNHYFVAEITGDLCGYAGLSVSGTDADIQTIAVSRNFQGQGLGRLLLKKLIDRSRELGVIYIFLEVRRDNANALSMYTSCGFVEISKRNKYYADGSDALILRRNDREQQS